MPFNLEEILNCQTIENLLAIWYIKLMRKLNGYRKNIIYFFESVIYFPFMKIAYLLNNS